MKTFKQITNILSKSINAEVYSPDGGNWLFYKSLTGIVQGNYYHISFRECKLRKTIEIYDTTEDPLIFVNIIQKIEPKAPITYTIMMPKVIRLNQ